MLFRSGLLFSKVAVVVCACPSTSSGTIFRQAQESPTDFSGSAQGVFGFTFCCQIKSSSVGVINLQAAPTELGLVCLLVYYRQCCIYDALGSRMFKLLFIVVSVGLFSKTE